MGSSYEKFDERVKEDIKDLAKLHGVPMTYFVERTVKNDDRTVQELKEALKERGLPVSGNKRVLIERLEGSSRGKNYLEKGALNAGDAELVEQIKAKYRTPDYRPPESKDSGYTKISNALIALNLSVVAALYFFFIEEHVIEVLKLTVSVAPVGGILAVITAGWLVLYIRQEIKKNEPIVSMVEISGLIFAISIGTVMGCAFWVALILGSPGNWILFYMCGCGTIITPLIIGNLGSGDDQTANLKRKIAAREKFTREHRRAWEDAQKHEEHNQFDAATGIWSKLGEEGEVERVTRLKTECLCVVLKRKIDEIGKMLNGFDKDGVDVSLSMTKMELAQTALSERKFTEAWEHLVSARSIGSKLKKDYGKSMEKMGQLKAKIAEFKEKGVNTDELEKILEKVEAEIGTASWWEE